MHSTSLLKAALKRGFPQKSLSVRDNEFSDRSNSAATAAATISSGQPAVKKAAIAPPPPTYKKLCSCAPTSHPGSFRCKFHRSRQRQWCGKPFSSAVKPVQRPPTSDEVLPNSSGAVLPAKKNSSRLSRVETADSVSSNSGSVSSRSSVSSDETNVASVLEDARFKDEEERRTLCAGKEVEITSNSSAILEDGYKCALKVIQISQMEAEPSTETAL